jgi:hypothetical protein
MATLRVCQYLTIDRSLSLYPLFSSITCPLSFSTSISTVFSQYAHSSLLYSLHSSQYLTLYYFSLLLFSLPSSTVCPMSVGTSHSTVLCHYAHTCLLKSVHSLTVHHTVLFFFTISTAALYNLSTVCQYLTLYCPVSLSPQLPFTVCPLSVITSSCTFLRHYIHSCIVQSVHSLSVPHTILFCVTTFIAVFYSLSTLCQ